MPISMNDPFIIPIGRDFSPRKQLQRKYGYPALDEVHLASLLEDGLERKVSFYTTHTVADNELIKQDTFSLQNPLFKIKINCELEDSYPLHLPLQVDFHKIPEKLWQQFRWALFTGPLPEDPAPFWYYNTLKLRMLKLELKFKIESHKFDNLVTIFNRNKINTLPLHFYHQWTYKGTIQRTEETDDGRVSIIEEKSSSTKIINVWKDFLIVRRDAETDQVNIGIGSDFHYSKKNEYIHQNYSESENINKKIKKFAKKIYNMWKNGELDYLILNGDFIDHVWFWGENGNWDITRIYNNSNWLGFEQTVKLFDSLRFSILPTFLNKKKYGFLFNVPIIWNLGDHDRLRMSYPLNPLIQNDDLTFERSHYNYFGVSNPLENMTFNISSDTRSSGTSKSHVAALRWVFERGRMEGWPLFLTLRIGDLNYNIICLDTGYMKGDFCAEPYPIEPFHCSGLKNNRFSELLGDADFNIVITHSPPVCLPPKDGLHEDGGKFSISEATYGIFDDHRNEFLNELTTLVEKKTPILVVSGHVHFGSIYSYTNSSKIETGPRIWSSVARLADIPILDTFHIEPEVFWGKYPCLLVTNPPIGPRSMKNGESSGFLLLRLGPKGISRIRWEEVTE